MDDSIRKFLNLRTTDLVSHYFTYILLALCVALCVWVIFHLNSNARLTDQILVWVPGFLAIAALPIMSMNLLGSIGNLQKLGRSLEILSVLCIALRYLQNRWSRSAWLITLTMAVHFAFWSREFGPYDGLHVMLFHFWDFRLYMLFVPEGGPLA
jgi:hypothetical protein